MCTHTYMCYHNSLSLYEMRVILITTLARENERKKERERKDERKKERERVQRLEQKGQRERETDVDEWLCSRGHFLA